MFSVGTNGLWAEIHRYGREVVKYGDRDYSLNLAASKVKNTSDTQSEYCIHAQAVLLV